jgi:hypothetical protein
MLIRMNRIADSLLLPECIYRPGSFSGLMMLYESNYLKLMQLMGSLDAQSHRWISRVRSDNNLHVERMQSERYTTTLNLTYWLRNSDGTEIRDPDMTVSIYHDAAQAAVLHCRAGHRHKRLQELAASHAGELSRRWQINMMLNKWLDYLGDCGHRFA